MVGDEVGESVVAVIEASAEWWNNTQVPAAHRDEVGPGSGEGTAWGPMQPLSLSRRGIS